ncbi:hypothetical protein XarbCFBP7408_05345 [Xanthomonas arboricola pv. guizotiae]|uniref:Uncharacterized protein n=1 Tax=Xanthomonas arboricola pv. guizotiae TaxID=487867 RepID=A0A2S7A688_9XANT|nr:hypothetical protein XarbCFBP7409_03825 [Xanthomonas arboricola pv. guizotiae]PPU25573.1 hypothetical protein XarbCFBP7408_05345 [Xanthomonas arboricola pv. guizotiae]
MHAAQRTTCVRGADAVKRVRAFYIDAIHSQIETLRWRSRKQALPLPAAQTTRMMRSGRN